MQNLLTNEQLLSDLQEAVDDGWILEQPDEILEFVINLREGEFEQLHDTGEKSVVRVYRNAKGFYLHSTGCTLSDYAEKIFFNLSDYDTGFDATDGFNFEAMEERKVERDKVRADKALTKLQRFTRIENAYVNGVKNIAHPYLTAKGFTPADINIEYSVIKADLFQSGKPLELLIYKLNDDAYQVITPAKINGSNKFIIIREEGAMKGSYAVVGDGVPEFIVEGLADAITANMALGRSVAVGINAGNIRVVAQELPELILIGDNDDAGRLSAKHSGLDAIFCPDHKDVDDFRQDKGITLVKRYLEREVARVEREREPTLGESNSCITLVSAPPGSGKSYSECQNICQRTGLTIYAVHNKKAMGQRDSRVSEIRELCESNSYELPVMRTINDTAHEDTITVQFNRAIDEYCAHENEDKNWVIFITHKALSLLNFENDALAEANLVIDEVPEAYSIHADKMTKQNLQDYLSYFEATAREYTSHYVVSLLELSSNGRTFYYSDENKDDLETKYCWKMIDQVLANRNHSNFLIIEKSTENQMVFCMNRPDENDNGYYLNVGNTPKINKCEMFNSSVFDCFANVRLLSDDVENSIFALLLKNTQGVEFDLQPLPSRHVGGIANRLDRIIGVTDKTFSKHKIEARPDLSNKIAAAVARECDLTESLWLLNNASRENGDATAWLEQEGYDVADLNPMTHGRNDLTRHNVIVMLYSLKPSPVEVALLEHLNISQAQITRWREHNVHMQNAFRGSLRNPGSDSTCTLVLPDKASVEYFLERVGGEWGVAERELVEAKVSYLEDAAVVADFENKKVGRKCSGDEPLTKTEKNTLSRWRKKFPDLNDFANAIGLSLKELVQFKVRQVAERHKAWHDSLVDAISFPDIVDDGGYSV
ncbi:hypothetical protein [Thalassomonas sp. M1454]|uniref:hypothetical protein n=1 Tax=Thalassomonas sp. M1454 TaxID=2594477 RepID=UPI0011801C3A|nr:hypothetical protein [Thalassomonas sp. M1454]TRX52749.1 hypothetical protein FNN08_15420 [Thalassomonas sp. M1454]